MAARTGVVYLLHFNAAYKHARHYCGWASDLQGRLRHHENGTGANLLRVLRDCGITWILVRTWDGTRDDERRLKNQGGLSRHCPVCQAKGTARK